MSPVIVTVDPGVCGFVCRIEVVSDAGESKITIESDCSQVKTFAKYICGLDPLPLAATPLGDGHPVISAAARSRLHPGCPITVALIKAAEAACGLALKKDVHLCFA